MLYTMMTFCLTSLFAICRYDFLGKDSDKPEHANGSAAPGKPSDERRPREHKSSRDRDRHRDREDDKGHSHRSSSRDHRSHKSSRHRDERDHRSSRDRDGRRDDPRDRYRPDPRGPDSHKRPRVDEPYLPRPPPPRFVHAATDQLFSAPVHLWLRKL